MVREKMLFSFCYLYRWNAWALPKIRHNVTRVVINISSVHQFKKVRPVRDTFVGHDCVICATIKILSCRSHCRTIPAISRHVTGYYASNILPLSSLAKGQDEKLRCFNFCRLLTTNENKGTYATTLSTKSSYSFP
ncbi:hypothetical protein RvY_00915 [Ramazzottius varieornatus]|uniref:Uncharacterized protein n=1 Tax=Ramazzottius varieornatus TaxID=947166 RepID=A0A1D1UEG2_RAMVA|nr:hypothetical protein RvY_00915 [Ramazzottius varieornatus]